MSRRYLPILPLDLYYYRRKSLRVGHFCNGSSGLSFQYESSKRTYNRDDESGNGDGVGRVVTPPQLIGTMEQFL